MKIINVSTAVIKDEKLFKEYITKAAIIMNEQGVEVICKAKYMEATRGSEMDSHIMAIFRYKDREAFNYFYNCKPYKELIPLRDESCDMRIQVYSEL